MTPFSMHLALLVLAAIPVAPAIAVDWEVRSKHFLIRTQSISDDSFATDRILLIAQLFRAEVSGKYAFAQLRLGRNSSELAQASSNGATDTTFDWW
jgi:hypothetical protein